LENIAMDLNKTVETQAWTFGAIAAAVAVVLPTLVQAAVTATPLVA
jgi:hypothetical protein